MVNYCAIYYNYHVMDHNLRQRSLNYLYMTGWGKGRIAVAAQGHSALGLGHGLTQQRGVAPDVCTSASVGSSHIN